MDNIKLYNSRARSNARCCSVQTIHFINEKTEALRIKVQNFWRWLNLPMIEHWFGACIAHITYSNIAPLDTILKEKSIFYIVSKRMTCLKIISSDNSFVNWTINLRKRRCNVCPQTFESTSHLRVIKLVIARNTNRANNWSINNNWGTIEEVFSQIGDFCVPKYFQVQARCQMSEPNG